MAERYDLSGRVALVTGGGRGIGRAHSLLLAERGAAVLVCDLGATLDGSGRDTGVADAVVEEIRAAGGRAEASSRDISNFEGGAAAVQDARDAFGRIDIVVNNAGVAGGAPIDEVDADRLEKVLAVNFYGTVGVTRAAWPHLRDQRWGRVINTVSEVALDTRISAGAGGIGYGAAKAAVWSATITLAQEGRPYGITVNAISPGAFTRMNAAMFSAQGPPPGLDLDPRHVARVVAWLASDDAADVTGRVIHAAGGQHREYIVARHRDTELVARVDAALSGEDGGPAPQ
jgi:NAD(P)-dependent dehydrogenase (short-subunit alcohol dehydrogenase family)